MEMVKVTYLLGFDTVVFVTIVVRFVRPAVFHILPSCQVINKERVQKATL